LHSVSYVTGGAGVSLAAGWHQRLGPIELFPHVGANVAALYRTFAASWAKAKPPTRATMIQSVYEEIVVRGEEFVSVRLTPEAYAHGLALALPAEVVVPALPTWGGPRRGSNMALARPTGVGRAISTCTIPIEGRDEWLAAARRLA